MVGSIFHQPFTVKTADEYNDIPFKYNLKIIIDNVGL